MTLDPQIQNFCPKGIIFDPNPKFKIFFLNGAFWTKTPKQRIYALNGKFLTWTIQYFHLNPIALLGGGSLHQQNSILNFTNLVDSSKLKFGQNIKLSMPDHIKLHKMHLLYIYKSYLRKIDFSTYYYCGGVFLHQHLITDF